MTPFHLSGAAHLRSHFLLLWISQRASMAARNPLCTPWPSFPPRYRQSPRSSSALIGFLNVMKSKFSACYGGSLPGTEKICSWTKFRVIHEQILRKSCPLVILQGTKAADRISEIAIFRNGISEICPRSYASWSSYLLRGYRFHVRGLCSLFANEINTKLTRLVTIF